MVTEVMSDLMVWLLAAIDDAEQATQACVDEVGPERAGDPYTDGSGTAEQDAFPSYPWGVGNAELAYMAGPGHPAYTLAEVAAKRERIDWIRGELADDPTDETARWLLKLEARPYAGRDGWQEEWQV